MSDGTTDRETWADSQRDQTVSASLESAGRYAYDAENESTSDLDGVKMAILAQVEVTTALVKATQEQTAVLRELIEIIKD